MKIYCSCCDKVQPVRIDNCRDAKTNEPFQDIVCAECDLVIAAGTDIVPPAQQQEPVAWRWENGGEDKWLNKYISLDNGGPDCPEDCEPLYTSPPASKPLTDAQIGAVAAEIWGSILIAPQSYQAFARAIEAAHGIKGGA